MEIFYTLRKSLVKNSSGGKNKQKREEFTFPPLFPIIFLVFPYPPVFVIPVIICKNRWGFGKSGKLIQLFQILYILGSPSLIWYKQGGCASIPHSC